MFRLLVCLTGFYLLPCGITQQTGSPLDAVLRSLSEVSDVNIRHGRDMQQTVDLFFRNTELPISCNSGARYRAIDGACNNLHYPNWGTPFRKMKRLLQPTYDDNLGKPRLFRGRHYPLPSARSVSTNCLLPDNPNVHDAKLTLMVMQFGQFLDHDITATPEFDEPKECCSYLNSEIHHHYYTGGPCYPIPIPRNDRHFQIPCMEFRRSMPANDTGLREQINVITSYIDASQVYGSSPKELNLLRLYRNGLLQTSAYNLLPKTGHLHRPCVVNDTFFCFNAGDVRVNEFPGLTSLHTLFHRQHNQIASILQQLNPHWRDETVFQESRRIIGALMQHISFYHHLPIVLGQSGMKKYGLFDEYRYDPNLNPEIFNSFATAAYRFGHSLIPRTLNTFSDKNHLIDNMFFRPHFQTENYGQGMEELIGGMSSRPCQHADKFFTLGVLDHLFEGASESGHAFDLMARNIQRGRDHGLPSYSEFLRLANQEDGSWGSSFGDLTNWGNFFNFEMNGLPQSYFSDLGKKRKRKKRKAGRSKRYTLHQWLWDSWFGGLHNAHSNRYKRRNGQGIFTPQCLSVYSNSFDDIDLYVGAMSEPAVHDAVLGQTFSYIVGKQFFKLKNGDRFWYESQDSKVAFTKAQLQAIKRMTLSRIVCDNTNIGSIQFNIFMQPSNQNPIVSCNSKALPYLDLSAWRDRRRY